MSVVEGYQLALHSFRALNLVILFLLCNVILDPVPGTSVTAFTFDSDLECQMTPMA